MSTENKPTRITINEEVRLPGTDIILEPSDVIEVYPAKKETEKKEEKKGIKKEIKKSALKKEFYNRIKKRIMEQRTKKNSKN